MAIFPSLEIESVVQIDDKTRFNAEKSFVSKDEADITLVEIEPEAGAGFIDVTAANSREWYLDWSYSGISRAAVISVRITTDGVPITSAKTIQVITAADDFLFSSDEDITPYESDVLKYVEKGRSSFLNKHRAVQGLIIDDLNDQGIANPDGSRITKAIIVDIREVNRWSKFWTLGLIFDDFQNSENDKFDEKAKRYFGRANSARKQSFLRLDLNGDGEISEGEHVDMTTKDLVRT